MADEKISITFRAEASLRDAFERAAKGNDRTVSQLLRDFMRDYVRRHAQGDLLADAPRAKKGG